MNTLLDFFIYFILTRTSDFFAQHYLTAAGVAFLIAGINSYYWNKKWTFKDTSAVTSKQLLRFYSASGVGLFVNQVTLWLSTTLIVQMVVNQTVADHADLVGKIIASLAAAGVNFLLQKLWTFRHVHIAEQQ